MNKTSSNKIVFTNYILMCLIVILHADNRGVSDYAHITQVGGYQLVYSLMNNLSTMAVPIFFALSGYLLFRNMSWNTVKRKLQSRVKSVLLPYLFWNLFFYGVYSVIEVIPFISSRINFNIPDITLKVLLFEQYANPPLWFLPKLFLLQIFAPVGLCFFQKLKKWNIVWLAALVISDMVVGFGYSNPIHWISVFYGAGYIAYFYSDKVENLSDSISNKRIIAGLCTVILFIIQSFCYKWFFAPLFWCGLMTVVKNIPAKEFMKTSFFMFCTHYFCVLTIRKVLLMVLGASQIGMFVGYIFTALITIIMLSIVGILFRKKLPRLYSALCGGR